jgi:predicted dehydrogenase
VSELRGAVIGCGFFANNHLHAWNAIEGVRLVALCDRDQARLASAGERFGVTALYEDADAMLTAEKPDFVDIVTTVPTHRPLVELAARHRIPAICQKPFAASMQDAQAMVDAMAAAGVPLMVHENFRWEHPIIAVRDAVATGRIGTPFWARISFRSNYDVVAGQPYLATGQRFIIEDLGVHVLDVARFLMGEVETLTARTQRVDPRVRAEDVATMLLGHTSGATSVVEASYASRFRVDPFPETLIDLEGPDGSVRLGQHFRLTIVDRDGAEEQDVSPRLLPWAERPWHGVQESVLNIQQHWVECLRTGAPPATRGEDNLRTSALVEAAYESAALNRTVEI